MFVPRGPIEAITWTNADPVQRCIYAAALGGDEL